MHKVADVILLLETDRFLHPYHPKPPPQFAESAQNITWVTPEGGGGPNYPNM